MTNVTHVVVRARADDPQTLAVLALADTVRGSEPSTVYAMRGAHAIEGVRPLLQLPVDAATLLVYHQRGAAPALVRRLIDRGGSLAVVARDTPPDELARRDLRALATAGATALATGSAAAARLTELGFGRVTQVPPIVARQRLAAVSPFDPTVHHLDVSVHGPLVLTVDDVVSAADAARVVRAYHVLRTYLVRAGHLAVAVAQTPDTNEAAVRRIAREIWGLRLTEAWAHRLRHRGERAALTRQAAVFVTAAPAAGDVSHALVAMAEGVPVVAPANEGAAEILGDGALLLPPDAGAELVAEAIGDLLGDEPRHARFAAAAVRAAARFDPAVVAPSWRAALAS